MKEETMSTDQALRNIVSSSVATGLRQPGEICWFNMVTPRPAEACEFFGALLGWKFAPMPGMRDGRTVSVEGRSVGAIWDQNAPDMPAGTPAFIGVAVRVESADATCELVRQAGGEARAPFDVLDAGRMAVCHDPTGAQFDIWQAKQHVGTDVDSRLLGAPCWFEERTHDVARATDFYARVLGWEPHVTAQTGMSYTTFAQGSRYVAGMVQCPASMKDVKPHWATFFTSDDVDATARRATELGAKLCMPPTDIPGIGRYCALVSPQGVALQLIKYLRD
jgi:predicted enzyme related to lactoylglutathione lyase